MCLSCNTNLSQDYVIEQLNILTANPKFTTWDNLMIMYLCMVTTNLYGPTATSLASDLLEAYCKNPDLSAEKVIYTSKKMKGVILVNDYLKTKDIITPEAIKDAYNDQIESQQLFKLLGY